MTVPCSDDQNANSRRKFLRWAIYSMIGLSLIPIVGNLATVTASLEKVKRRLNHPVESPQSSAEDAYPSQCCQVACPSYPCEYQFGGGSGGCQVACPSYPCEYYSGCTGGGSYGGCYSGGYSGCSSGGGCYSGGGCTSSCG